MAIRALQGGTLNEIQFVPANGGLPISVKQWQMGKEWFREAQLSWQKRTSYYIKKQLSDTITVQYNRTDINDINLTLLSCTGVEVVNLTSLAETVAIAGNTYQGEQLTTHHFSFKPSTYLGTTEGTYYLRLDAIYYDGVDEIDRLTMYSEPISIKASHPLTTLINYRYLVNKEDIIFVNPSITPFSFSMRLEGWIENYQPDSADVYFKEQNYNQRVISSKPWRKFTLQAGGNKGVPPYIVEKLNAALSCGMYQGVLQLNNVRYTKDDGAKIEVEQMGVAYPLLLARVDIREYDPTRAITFARNSSFLIVEGGTYPYNIQRIDFNNPTILRVVSSIEGTTEIYDSGDLDAFVTWFNTTRVVQLNLKGEATRVGDSVYYTNGEGENYTSNFRIQDNYLINFVVDANAAPKSFYLSLAEGYGTIFWGNGGVNLHEPSDTVSHSYEINYTIDNDYTVKLWHNGIITSISHDSRTITNGVTTYQGRITAITGAAPWRMKNFGLGGENFSGLLDLSFLAAAGIVQEDLTTLSLNGSTLTGLDGTVFADNPYTSTNRWWKSLKIVNLNDNAFDVSEINSFVNDFYDNTPHSVPGSLYLKQNPQVTATGTAATKIGLLTNAGWYVQQ